MKIFIANALFKAEVQAKALAISYVVQRTIL